MDWMVPVVINHFLVYFTLLFPVAINNTFGASKYGNQLIFAGQFLDNVEQLKKYKLIKLTKTHPHN